MRFSIQRLQLVVVAVFVLCMCAFLVPMAASAGTKKVDADTNSKKCKAVKTGTTQITAKACTNQRKRPCVKFTAKKNDTYTFEFSNLCTKKKDTNSWLGTGIITFCHRDRNGMMEDIEVEQLLDGETAATGTSKNVLICSHLTFAQGSQERGMYSSLPERSISLNMKKGETVYICFQFAETSRVNCNIYRYYFQQL